MYNLKNLLSKHLFNVEFIQVFCAENLEPVTYDYHDIFYNPIFDNYFLDDSKVHWCVYTDGCGSQVLRISPKYKIEVD